jgi:hypothetical protein
MARNKAGDRFAGVSRGRARTRGQLEVTMASHNDEPEARDVLGGPDLGAHEDELGGPDLGGHEDELGGPDGGR